MNKFSDRFMVSVGQFYEAAKIELGEDFGGKQALAMFDALDPDIRGELLLRTFARQSNEVTLKFDPKFAMPSLINATRALRVSLKMGLIAAKSRVDTAHAGHDVSLGILSSDVRRTLHNGLDGTGWYIE